MATTFEDLIYALKDRGTGELVGGRIIARLDGRHQDLGGFDQVTGVFNLTADGMAFVEANAKPAPKPRSRAKTADSDLPDLD